MADRLIVLFATVAGSSSTQCILVKLGRTAIVNMAFSSWKASELQNFLKERDICSSNTKKELLLSRVRAAAQLDVPVRTAACQEDVECDEYKQKVSDCSFVLVLTV